MKLKRSLNPPKNLSLPGIFKVSPKREKAKTVLRKMPTDLYMSSKALDNDVELLRDTLR